MFFDNISSTTKFDNSSSKTTINNISSSKTKSDNISSTIKIENASSTKKIENISSTKTIENISSTKNIGPPSDSPPKPSSKRTLRSNSFSKDKASKLDFKNMIVSLSGFDDNNKLNKAVETKLRNFVTKIDNIKKRSKFEQVFDNPCNKVVNKYNGDSFNFSIDCEILNFNHLITPRSELRKCSIPILLAIARGNFIVTDRWLNDSIATNDWVLNKQGYRNQHYQYLPLSTQYRLQPVWSNDCDNKLLVFSNWNIFIASTSTPFNKTVKLLLETAGASICNDFSNNDNEIKFILTENSNEFIKWLNMVKIYLLFNLFKYLIINIFIN
jgi:hypothetical protein